MASLVNMVVFLENALRRSRPRAAHSLKKSIRELHRDPRTGWLGQEDALEFPCCRSPLLSALGFSSLSIEQAGD